MGSSLGPFFKVSSPGHEWIEMMASGKAKLPGDQFLSGEAFPGPGPLTPSGHASLCEKERALRLQNIELQR